MAREFVIPTLLGKNLDKYLENVREEEVAKTTAAEEAMQLQKVFQQPVK